jgi:protein phosphatase
VNWEDLLDIGGLTDVGMRRSNNQDSFRALPASSQEQWRQRGHLFIVADGMGAHAVGELASKLAVDTIPHTYHKLVQLPCDSALVKAFQDANLLIHNRGTANRDFQGMGTTSTALALLPDGALIAHVGDSRGYRVRSGVIEQLSFDHSLAWELVRRRRLTPEQARGMVPNNVITRSLGPEPDVQVDVQGPWAVEQGDVFVLCSDGLSGQVADSEIGLIASHITAQEACQYLVDLANLRGGPDNITVIVVRVGTSPPPGTQAAAKPRERRGLSSRSYAILCMVLGAISLLGCIGFWLFGSGNFEFSGAVGLVLLLGGAIWHFDSSRRLDRPPAQQATAYRQAECRLQDKTALDGLTARLQQLRSLAVEQSWNLEWSEFFAHRNAAEQHVEGGELESALREICQAFHLLAMAQRRRLEDTRQLLSEG